MLGKRRAEPDKRCQGGGGRRRRASGVPWAAEESEGCACRRGETVTRPEEALARGRTWTTQGREEPGQGQGSAEAERWLGPRGWGTRPDLEYSSGAGVGRWEELERGAREGPHHGGGWASGVSPADESADPGLAVRCPASLPPLPLPVRSRSRSRSRHCGKGSADPRTERAKEGGEQGERGRERCWRGAEGAGALTSGYSAALGAGIRS